MLNDINVFFYIYNIWKCSHFHYPVYCIEPFVKPSFPHRQLFRRLGSLSQNIYNVTQNFIGYVFSIWFWYKISTLLLLSFSHVYEITRFRGRKFRSLVTHDKFRSMSPCLYHLPQCTLLVFCLYKVGSMEFSTLGPLRLSLKRTKE